MRHELRQGLGHLVNERARLLPHLGSQIDIQVDSVTVQGQVEWATRFFRGRFARVVHVLAHLVSLGLDPEPEFCRVTKFSSRPDLVPMGARCQGFGMIECRPKNLEREHFDPGARHIEQAGHLLAIPGSNFVILRARGHMNEIDPRVGSIFRAEKRRNTSIEHGVGEDLVAHDVRRVARSIR